MDEQFRGDELDEMDGGEGFGSFAAVMYSATLVVGGLLVFMFGVCCGGVVVSLFK